VLEASAQAGVGVIAFSPLAQGQLTDRYLKGVPADSRMALGHFLKRDVLTEQRISLLHALNKLAEGRGQTLAQMALAWVLRDPRVVSVLIGASSVAQLEQNVAVLDSTDFTDAELAEIDRLSAENGVEIP
ncbi:aldo/keto reductase, partial [Streptomyces sp. 2MCAF27]